MAYEKFVAHSFGKKSLQLIETCNGILSEYERQGYQLSLRQLYYQLVARDYIENSVKSYKRIGDLVSNARDAGMMDWAMIEDRNRETVANGHWENPGEILQSAAYAFKMDRWERQPCYVEVFVEKDALSGILLPVCRELDVRFTANKGYSSSSAMYRAAKRLLEAAEAGKDVHIIYLGDHDPSGIDMTRDVRERLSLYTHEMFDFEVHRLALNYDQVELWRPPENPAKESDSRYEAYATEFGVSSWELDAVEPATLARLVRTSIEQVIDEEEWDKVERREKEYKDELRNLASRY